CSPAPAPRRRASPPPPPKPRRCPPSRPPTRACRIQARRRSPRATSRPNSLSSSQPAPPAEEGEHADDGDRHQADGGPKRLPGVEAGEVDVHPEEAGDERERREHDDEDREDVEDVVLLVGDERLVRVL